MDSVMPQVLGHAQHDNTQQDTSDKQSAAQDQQQFHGRAVYRKNDENDRITVRIQDLKQQRQAASVRAGQLQEEFNKTVVQVHQLDGAIAALEQLVTKNE